MSLDRKIAVPRLLAEHRQLLLVSGLAGASKDMAALTDDGDHLFTMAGAMGSACSVGLGLALAQPERGVVVITGDGELMMSIGSLATIASVGPTNLVVVCVNNAHHGETGYQPTHTATVSDLLVVARGMGIADALRVDDDDSLENALPLWRAGAGPRFIDLHVDTSPPPRYKRSFDAVKKRLEFRDLVSRLSRSR